MTRCLQLARQGLGKARPNPSVGCVIVHQGKIIGEGFTSPYGGPHAEVNAIESVEQKDQLPHSDLYVTLEPCNHYGKTPPCTELIKASGIKTVYVGCTDPNPNVNGSGAETLQADGIEVVVGVLKELCEQHHKRFLCYHQKNRPYIILKWAQTKNGFIAPADKSRNEPVWISNRWSRQLVHKWRTEEQAILVGANTVLVDNPKLTARDWSGLNPIRIVMERSNSISKEYDIFNDESETMVLEPDEFEGGNSWPQQLGSKLYDKKVTSLIVEGGAKTLNAFIRSGLWDEARVFIGDVEFNSGIQAPDIHGSLQSTENIGTDTLNTYRND